MVLEAIKSISSASPPESILVLCNFTPVVRRHYRIGVDEDGEYEEIWNSDDTRYGGSGVHAIAPGTVLAAEPVALHGRAQSLSLTLPPLATICLRRRAAKKATRPATAKAAPERAPKRAAKQPAKRALRPQADTARRATLQTRKGVLS